MGHVSEMASGAWAITADQAGMTPDLPAVVRHTRQCSSRAAAAAAAAVAAARPVGFCLLNRHHPPSTIALNDLVWIISINKPW